MQDILIVFIHGYSVTSFETYGQLPQRLAAEAKKNNLTIDIRDIFLARYISFNDQVKLSDVARALEAAIKEQIPANRQFVCITHSTGGPVAREWLHNFYKDGNKCPMTHLIMLAPANHGSALAQLGKSRLSRLRSWMDGVEAGQNILDWLELGSEESLQLNKDWIFSGSHLSTDKDIFLFVITGQDIDRKLYDHINSYTGEIGSDGVVRVASANLNSTYIKLEQQIIAGQDHKSSTPLVITDFQEAPEVPFRVLKRKSHSGDDMGIMRSVKNNLDDKESAELISCIFACLNVKDKQSYLSLVKAFQIETTSVQEESKIELEIKPLRNKLYIHDRYSMIIFRVHDSEGNLVPDFDLILTADNNDPDLLPTGFFSDRQFNRVNKSCITYFVNYDVMKGTAEVRDPDGELVRRNIPGLDVLGLIVNARPTEGFVRYTSCMLPASAEFLSKVIRPNTTCIIDIYLKRLISSEVFRLEKYSEENTSLNFKNTLPGTTIV